MMETLTSLRRLGKRISIISAAAVMFSVFGMCRPAAADTVNGIIIHKEDIGATAKFYPYTAKGTKMEVIAVRAHDGSIRTALNTCQACYDSGRGYYVQKGDTLVCQNCGNVFKIDRSAESKAAAIPYP
jgi:uncharacterized membrane protein